MHECERVWWRLIHTIGGIPKFVIILLHELNNIILFTAIVPFTTAAIAAAAITAAPIIAAN